MRKLTKAVVADDNRIERMVLREMLASHGIEVIEARDGEHAQELIEEHLPELVISDLLMPRQDGFALANWLLQAELDPKPLLFLSSAVYKGAQWKHEALTTCQADEFLVKPITPAQLDELLEKYFGITPKNSDNG